MNDVSMRIRESSRRQRRCVASVMLIVACAMAASCASVKIRKVPTPAQYENWGDRLQRKADAMEGLRFYLPRPFVNVFESFPVSTDVYFVNGVVSPGGQFVRITDVRADSPLISLFASSLTPRGDYEVQVESSNVIVPDQSAIDLHAAADEAAKSVNAQLQSEVESIVEEAKASADKAASEAGAAKSSAMSARKDANRAETSTPPRTGVNRAKATNDNGAFAYQPLRGNFDVVYLPDFDEQYVVTSRANLGNAEFEINLGQGWSLQGFNSLTDNSEVNNRVFDLIDTSIAAAKAAAGAALPGAQIPALAGTVLQAASDDEAGAEDVRQLKGTEVTLKIVVVHYAAKGIYPVLKPRELLHQSPQVAVIDPFDDEPTVREISAIDDPAIAAAIDRHRLDRGRYTVPVYPYQYISFNTFRYVAVELVTSTGAPFGTLYDATGTTGSPGNARTSDPPTGGGRPNSGDPQNPVTDSNVIEEITENLNNELESGGFDRNELSFTVENRSTGGGLDVRLNLENDTAFSNESRQKVIAIVEEQTTQYEQLQFVRVIPLSDERLAQLEGAFNDAVATVTFSRRAGTAVEFTIVTDVPDDSELMTKLRDLWVSAWTEAGNDEDDAALNLVKAE